MEFYMFYQGSNLSEKVNILTILLTFAVKGEKFQILHYLPTLIPEHQHMSIRKAMTSYAIKNLKSKAYKSH